VVTEGETERGNPIDTGAQAWSEESKYAAAQRLLPSRLAAKRSQMPAVTGRVLLIPHVKSTSALPVNEWMLLESDSPAMMIIFGGRNLFSADQN